MKKIPRFSQDDIEGIARLLGEEGIPFEFEGTTTDISNYGGTTEFYVIVHDEDFVDAVSLLMIHYRITEDQDEPYSGPCPACESTVHEALECPDCGLSLSIRTPKKMISHPFHRFLRENELLEQSDSGD